MGKPKGMLVTPVADNPDDELRSLEVDANDYLKVAEQGTPTVIAKPHADEKLFGFERVIANEHYSAAAGTTHDISGTAVPTGKIWKITHVSAANQGGDIASECYLQFIHNGTYIRFHKKVGSTAQYATVDKHVELWLDAGDYIKVYFEGVASGEYCYLWYCGYEMNAP